VIHRLALPSTPALLTAVLVGCPLDSCDDSGGPSLPAPELTAIQVVPQVLYLGATEETFSVHARAVDQWGFRYPATLTWLLPASATLLTTSGDTAQFQVPLGVPELEIAVSADGQLDVLRVLRAAPLPDMDLALAAGSAPGMAGAMVRGRRDNGACTDLSDVIAFVGHGRLGRLEGAPACDPLALVAQVGMAIHEEGPLWNASAQAIDGHSDPPKTVGIEVWTTADVDPSVLAPLVDDEIDEANAIFHHNRVGLRLVRDPTIRLHPGSPPVPSRCDGPDYKAEPGWMAPAGPFPTNLLVVLYAPTVTGLGAKSTVFTRRGLFCRPNVILINRLDRVPTTLAHEVGHALGLVEPWGLTWGHTNAFTGLRPAQNLMHDASSERRHLSLGQIYRMHHDRRSWLTQPLFTPGLDCGCDPYSSGPPGNCPTLVADFRATKTPPINCTSMPP